MQMTPAKVHFAPPAGQPAWDVEGLEVHDRFGEPYRMKVALRTDDLAAEPAQMLGQSVSVSIERGDRRQDLGGIVERVTEGEHDGTRLHVVVSVVPALVALAHRRNSRIFQELTVPQVLEQVLGEALGDYGRSVDVSELQADHPTQEYTVQYRESDLDFAHRLMEEHGIGYRFVTNNGVETMVLWDGETVFDQLRSEGNAAGVLPMRPQGGDPGLHEDVQQFERTSSLQPTVARTAVFDWHVPKPLQDGQHDAAASFGAPNGATVGPEREDYDHLEPAVTYGHRSQALQFSHVNRLLELRRAVHQRNAVRCSGRSTATQMSPGLAFDLLDHPQSDLAGKYVVVGVEHAYGLYAGGEAGSGYHNRFACLPAAVAWRPDRRRPKPRIAGMQTATVVGPAGEEIHTDDHGRIKVQMHWDRGGGFGDGASCFVRVVQPWAGNGWGTFFVPRIGMEVAVTFIDGDPDRPIVTGSLYNGANPPPYGAASKTSAAIKSNSSPGGGGSNELRMGDGAGGEEIYLHAQKDHNEVVGNNHGVTIANDETISVGNNQTLDVAVDQTETIGSNQTKEVGANHSLKVGANQELKVSGNQTVAVLGTHKCTITGSSTETIIGGVTSTINAGLQQTINAGATYTVNGGLTCTVNGSTTMLQHGNLTQVVDGVCNMLTTGGINLVSPAGVTVMAPGGVTMVDPATTSEVHGVWDSIKAVATSLITSNLSIKAMSVNVTGLSVSATGVSVSATGVSNSRTAVSSSATGVSVSATGLDISATGAYMRFSGINLLA